MGEKGAEEQKGKNKRGSGKKERKQGRNWKRKTEVGKRKTLEERLRAVGGKGERKEKGEGKMGFSG